MAKGIVAQERTPECSAVGRGSNVPGGTYYFPAPQQSTFIIFCIVLGFSGCCCLGCVGFGVAAGTARLFDDKFGWLCWNCACVEAPSGGANSPMLFLLICESRCVASLGLLPGWTRVAPGFGRGSFKRWWSIGRCVLFCLCGWPWTLTAVDELWCTLALCICWTAEGCDFITSHPFPLFSFIQSYSPSSISPVLFSAWVKSSRK